MQLKSDTTVVLFVNTKVSNISLRVYILEYNSDEAASPSRPQVMPHVDVIMEVP